MRDGIASPAYKRYLLVLLTVILVFNRLDLIALGVVLESVKRDLALSDTQLGFLTGIAFALFYSLMGIPIARWADRGNRIVIVVLTTAVWSIAVALCGLAASFVQLLLIRVLVAIGEAGCIPTANSLIADYFSRAERPRAVARYMLGGALALVIGYFASGWLNQLYGWRMTFVIIGLPGVGLALLAAFTLREPRRLKAVADRVDATADKTVEPTAGDTTLKEVFTTLWRNVTFRHLVLCYSVWAFFGFGLVQWQATFFIRSYAMTFSDLGFWLALVQGGGALLGIYLGGEWSTRRAANDERRQLIAVALMFSFFGLFNGAAYLAPNQYMAFALMAVAAIGGNMAHGPIVATIQTLVPAHMRAMALATIYLVSNLIGMGLGPLAVGILSDAFHGWAGAESLRYALVFFCPGYVWAAWYAWRASETVGGDVARTQEALASTAR